MRTFSLMIIIISCSYSCKEENVKSTNYIVQKANSIQIDGIGNENDWNTTDWRPIDQKWLGDDYDSLDFSGRYKLLWGDDLLYVLAEIEDDTLIDIHPNGLDKYWDDDCLEIFVDEDASGGNHQYSHNAWAYHLSLDGKCVDIGPDTIFRYYPHVDFKRITKGTSSTWELGISLYNDQYKEGNTNAPVKLNSNKLIGFAIAYCDNDHSPERENFIGSTYVEGDDKNRGWIDAGIFETVELE